MATEKLNKTETQIAVCSFSECENPAEWVIGTWQCCDEHAKEWVTKSSEDEGFSFWGTSKRIGQKAILAHNIKFNLPFIIDN